MELTEGTRGEILKLIKSRGEATVPELRRQLEIAPNAIRGHLAILEREGLIAFRWRKQPRGRPLKVYYLSEQAEGLFPKQYDQLLEELITEIAHADGAAKFQQLLEGMARRWARDLAPELKELPLESRLQEIARHLDLGGMMAFLEKEDAGLYNLKVFNCVYRRTSQAHREICTLIPTLIGDLTGAKVTVERSIHVGNAHCQYLIEVKRQMGPS